MSHMKGMHNNYDVNKINLNLLVLWDLEQVQDDQVGQSAVMRYRIAAV